MDGRAQLATSCDRKNCQESCFGSWHCRQLKNRSTHATFREVEQFICANFIAEVSHTIETRNPSFFLLGSE